MSEAGGAGPRSDARAARPVAGAPRWYTPLRARRFRLFWIARTVSGFGDALAPVALAFTVLRLGGSPTDLGAVLAVATASRVLFVLVGGVASDRMPRRLVILGSDTVLATVQALLAVALLAGRAELWMLLVSGAVFGAAGAFVLPATAGLVPQMVDPNLRQQANALVSVARSLSRMIGPAVSGVIVGFAGTGPVFALDAATFLVSAACLARLRLPAGPAGGRGSVLSDLREGWRALRARGWYLVNLVAHGCWNLGFAVFLVLGPVVAAEHYGGAPAWGLISSGMALGTVLGGVLALRWLHGRPVVLGNLLLAVSALQLVALVPPVPALLVAAAALLGAAGLAYLNDVWLTATQSLFPPGVVSRISSYDWLISLVAAPLGYALAGPSAAALGRAATLLVAAGLVAVPCALAALLPGARAVRRRPDGTMTGPPVPATMVA